MSSKSESQSGSLDLLKWLLVVALVAVGVGGNYYFSSESLLYRVLALVALSIVAVAVALQTTGGQSFFKLVKEARTEIRKVIWPTRAETGQTTLIVVAVVFVMALVLWGLDSFFSWLVSLLIG
ncbi:MAG: preprotein translocase subunit SecE [Pseudomonadales bacterium]|jgi:preprotein translocase subunit SecE|nr:preprotein translocase subunit SecE [Pseudomonadales bacterium]